VAELKKRPAAAGKRARPGALVVGVCGGIGSGKSTVAHLLRELGARVVDADAISHDVLEEADVKQTVLQKWGKDLLTETGKIDRAKLGQAVFAKSEDVQELERLMHPRVRARMLKEIEMARKAPSVKVVVIDAPLILEGGLTTWCDALVFVDSARSARLSRLARRHGWDEETVTRREREQMPVEEKRRKCDHVVENFGSLEDLQRRVKELYDVLASA
jgi:dephospho-CoA kinase